MDIFLKLFLMPFLTALTIENAVITRILGIDRRVLNLNSYKTGIIYGAVFTVSAFAASALVSVVILILGDHRLRAYLRAPLFSLAAIIVYFVLLWASAKLLDYRHVIKELLPYAVFNTAVFGIFYISTVKAFTIPEILSYSLGTGLGCTLALLLICNAKRRLSLIPVPRPFRGIPILLVYLGILSLAVYGFVGHGILS